MSQPSGRICLVPRLQGVGGMVSFQAKLAAGLARLGYEVCYNLADLPYQSVLVIGGTSSLSGLRQARRNGVRIVQRLNGMNWIHRQRRTGLKHFLRSEYGNLVLSSIRRWLADAIVYQSAFSHAWWERVYGPTRQPWTMVHNGVDLQTYTPLGEHDRPAKHFRILLVEGSLGGGYEIGLETGVALARRLQEEHRLPVEVNVAGRVSPGTAAEWQAKAGVPLSFAGLVPAERIPWLDRSAHLLYAADINAACPNSVIEALACGLPVLAFDTGALPELVSGEAGAVVPYGGDPWQLAPPDVPGLAQAALELLARQETFRAGARQRAEAAFGLEPMVERYLDVLVRG